ncbi:S8 family serine peptidase [Helicobacter sp.]|uniref:S8 family serine peptidase n=1 Tax=Helicobacter sp. TaxID=218 RepID=UPI002A761843|nr:S8 family serine peptidase [Helicobacter sp.]MDY2585402.1 S8 family serine peptidase [Helicobacter sp.]
MKILYILLNLLCLIIFTACGGGNILSLTFPSKPIYTNPSPKPTTPKPTTPPNLNQPSPSTPNSPPTPPIITTSAIPLQHLIATKFPIANRQSITIPPPTIPSATIFDENTLKHIGVIDGGFGDLAAQYFNDSKVTFIGRQLPLKDRTHGTNVSNIIIRNAKNTTNLYVLEAGDTTDPTRKNLLTGFGHYRAIYNQGVRIFNNSFGTNPTDNLDSIKNIFYNLYDNLKDLASKEGAIFVWATGNESQDLASDQASLPELYNAAKKGWIAVTALDTSNKLASYANQLGRAKDWGIAALGTLNNDGTGAEGTSYAAPRVTAAVSKVWEQFPWMDNHLVTQTILSTANACEKGNCNQGDKPTTGPNNEVGWGALNVERALKGPARFDKRLLLQGQEQVEVNFSYRNYTDRNKLTWSNDIAGDAGLKKEGTGTLYLSGNNTYSGKTDINGGALVLTGDGITQSPITIGQDGILQANNAKTITTAGKGLTNNGIFEVYGKGAKIAGNYKGGGNTPKSTLTLIHNSK